jgi:primosomal protein N' (replication factor Y)
VALVAEILTKIVQKVFADQPVLGPAPAVIQRIYNDFRWESFLKLDPAMGTKKMEFLLDRVFELYDQHKPQGATSVRINVNVDV